MGCFRISLFAVAFAVGTSLTAHAQSWIDHPRIVIDVVELEGTRLSQAAQEQLIASLKQREWEEKPNWEADVTNLVVNAERWQDWENEGYSGCSLSVGWKPLRREPGLLHVFITVHVNEGTQKRLKNIEIRGIGEHKGQSALVSKQLRKRIPLNDGEIYNRDKFYDGLSAVATAYKERGFIDCTITPTISFDDDNRTVSAVMEITEGPVYRWGRVEVIGLDPEPETILRTRLPKDGIVNPKLIRDFYQQYKSSLPVGASPETVQWKRDRQRVVVDITFDFSTPPPQAIYD
jgi:outer membrane protein assembly factor BamA